jgi:hypothetical protein
MTPSSPGEFAQWAREAGFSPAQALWLAQERRMLLAPFLVGSSITLSPAMEQALEARKNLAMAIQDVKVPGDIRVYKEKWVPCLFNQPDADRYSLPGEKKSQWVSWMMSNPSLRDIIGVNESSEFIHRLSNVWLYGLSESERAIAETDPDWDDVEAVVESHVISFRGDLTVSRPSDNAAEAMRRLQEVVDQAGIEVLSWAGDESLEMMDTIRVGLEDSIRRLATRLGVEESMPLLGLGGRLSLFVGTCDVATGRCGSRHGMACITLSPRVGFGSLAHEWFHALDGWLAYIDGVDGFASEAVSSLKSPMVSVARTLVCGLKGGDGDKEKDHSELWHEAHETWQARMESLLGKPLPDLAREAVEMQNPEWDEKAAAQRWVERFRGTPFEGMVDGADRLVTEMRLLRNYGEKIRLMPGEAYRMALKESPNEGSRWLGEYLENPSELLAHNFESGFEKNAPFADSAAGETTLRYPLKGEATIQSLHWKRFFKAIRPVLDTHFSPQAHPPEISIDDASLRLAARRRMKISPDSTPVFPLPSRTLP